MNNAAGGGAVGSAADDDAPAGAGGGPNIQSAEDLRDLFTLRSSTLSDVRSEQSMAIFLTVTLLMSFIERSSCWFIMTHVVSPSPARDRGLEPDAYQCCRPTTRCAPAPTAKQTTQRAPRTRRDDKTARTPQ